MGEFSYGGQSSQSRKCHLHAIRGIDINYVASRRSTPQLHKGTSRDQRLCQPYDHLWSRPTLQELYNQTLKKLGAIVSTLHLKMKFPTLTGVIVTAKADQKQARQCCAESLKVAPYPPTREPAKPHPTTDGTTQVMSTDKRSPI
ncbi:hypothetical protein JHK85_001039 [Glycine max]|nr:hypothetical protein JHK85_001039 [Glycine max]KAG5088396.1 hypothetical protein JHK86_001008 [Glycine max]